MTEGVVLLLSGTPPSECISYQVTRSKRWATSLRPHTPRLFLPAPQSTHHPIIPPISSAPASHHRSLLSSHTHPLSRCRLIDEATFDNGIRNRGVYLVIRYYQSCLITAEEDPRQTDGFLGAQIWPQIMKLCDGVL